MFERFTEKAIKAVMSGKEESQRLGHAFVSTEHLLLGIFIEGSSIAYEILKKHNVDIQKLRTEVKRISGTGLLSDTIEKEDFISFTPRAKIIIENAYKHSKELKNNVVTPVHLLLALLNDKENIATSILYNLNLDVTEIYSDLLIEHKLSESDNSKNIDYLDEVSNKYNSNDFKIFSQLENYATNLTKKKNDINKIYEREKELELIVRILIRRKNNNPYLIGESGVGKKSIIESLVHYIENNFSTSILAKKILYLLNINLLIYGTKNKNEFEERIQIILDEVSQNKNIILVIDELHTLIGNSSTEGSLDVSYMFKSALSSGQLQCIGISTNEEYRKYIEKNKKYGRYFKTVNIPELTVKETISILESIKKEYEIYHNVEITSEAIEASVLLSQQFITDRFLPEKAIDLLDETCANVSLNNIKNPKLANPLMEKVRILNEKKLEASRKENYTEALEWKHCADEISLQIDYTSKKLFGNIFPKGKVKKEHIAEILASWTGVPVNKISDDENKKLLNIEEILHSRVIGQEIAVTAISRAIRRARVGLKNPNRPIASFIFSGPTGVGKTELTKALATFLFGSEDSMIRLDMSEYMERHSISKLIGSPPGYIGYEEGGFLTEKVKTKPYSVILFDEVEKAHPDIFNLLLQILEDGRLSDSKGQVIDFKNTLIILTSNIGSKVIEKNALQKKEYLVQDNDNSILDEKTKNLSEYKLMSSGVQKELKEYFRPELLNRLDEIIVFKQLSKLEVRKIADIMIKNLSKLILKQGYIVEISESVKDKLAHDGFDPIYGARPLRRVIMSSIEDRLANFFLVNKIEKKSIIKIDLDDFGNIQLIDTKIKQEFLEDIEQKSKEFKDNVEAYVIKLNLEHRKEIENKKEENNLKKINMTKNSPINLAKIYKKKHDLAKENRENNKRFEEETRQLLNMFLKDKEKK